MKQMSLGESGFERKTKRTRKREFLDEMNLVVPWAELVSLIAPHAPAPGAKGGRPPFAVETMLRIHFIQQWFNLSDPAMEEALYDMALFREFVGLDAGEDNLPDESTILRFRHLLEAHNLGLQILATVNATLAAKGLLLKSGTVVDATLIAAPSSTKNSSGERDPEMHQTKKGNQCTSRPVASSARRRYLAIEVLPTPYSPNTSGTSPRSRVFPSFRCASSRVRGA